MGLFVANKSFVDALNISCAVLRTGFGLSEKSSSSKPTFNKIKKVQWAVDVIVAVSVPASHTNLLGLFQEWHKPLDDMNGI